ncbi:MAG: ribbon-helix-helix protein, CopG family [Alphaproteobacteria bacterium]|nr:ribbon-helix-helix protein, CopG family [Alphaproteobacteria bacterium]MBV9693961.1 ribbon-helix-helix protein, CopG family [Alphaproteobacteria bacterium]
MKLTLTLDDDMAARLELLRERRGVSWNEIVNEVIRRGLDVIERQSKTSKSKQ